MILAAIVLTVLLVVMQLLDAWTTYRILQAGGRELNPLLERLRNYIVYLPYGGPWLWLALGKSWVIVALAIGWWFGVWANGIGVVILMAMACFYAWILDGNYRAMKG